MQKNETEKNGFAICVAKGFLAGIAVILALLAVFAALVSSGRIPESAMGTLTWLTAFLGSFAGVVVAVKCFDPSSRTLITGLAVSGAFIVMTLVGAAFSDRDSLISAGNLWIFVALLCGGILGSFVKTQKKSRKR